MEFFYHVETHPGAGYHGLYFGKQDLIRDAVKKPRPKSFFIETLLWTFVTCSTAIGFILEVNVTFCIHQMALFVITYWRKALYFLTLEEAKTFRLIE